MSAPTQQVAPGLLLQRSPGPGSPASSASYSYWEELMLQLLQRSSQLFLKISPGSFLQLKCSRGGRHVVC